MRFTALLHHLTPDMLVTGQLLQNLNEWLPPAWTGSDVARIRARPGVNVSTTSTVALCIAVPTGHDPRSGHGIPKADGRQRPPGIAALEDKIVQQAVKTVLEQFYEGGLPGSSATGFGPGEAVTTRLDALCVGIEHRKV